MLELLAALFVTCASVVAIFLSWQRRNMPFVALSGWMLAGLSLVLWSWALGPEFGVTYATIVFVMLVWVRVGMGMDSPKRSGDVAERPYRALTLAPAPVLLKHSGIFLLSVPVTGVLTLMLSVALVLHLPWTLLTRGAVAIFLYPVLWGALSAWICTQEKLLKPVLVSLALFLASSLLLFV